MLKRSPFQLPALAFAVACFASSGAETFRVATYNVENYLDQPTESRPHTKSPEAKAKVCESIRALNPDVLALEEMGSTDALLELRDSLQARGTGLSALGTCPGHGYKHSCRRAEPAAHRRPPSTHERHLSARRAPLSRQPRFCRRGNPGEHQLHLHAHCRAPEIAPPRARSRRSRGTPGRSQNSAGHR